MADLPEVKDVKIKRHQERNQKRTAENPQGEKAGEKREEKEIVPFSNNLFVKRALPKTQSSENLIAEHRSAAFGRRPNLFTLELHLRQAQILSIMSAFFADERGTLHQNEMVQEHHDGVDDIGVEKITPLNGTDDDENDDEKRVPTRGTPTTNTSFETMMN